MVSLDRSFSIAPAKREIVTRGPYQYMRHPMYAGETLSLIGVLLASFSLWNIFFFSIFFVSIFWRVRAEEKILSVDDDASDTERVLRYIFESIESADPIRHAFFYQWLQNHFGFTDLQSVESYLAGLSKKKVAQEINIVISEYLWCQKESLERITQLHLH